MLAIREDRKEKMGSIKASSMALYVYLYWAMLYKKDYPFPSCLLA